MSKNKIHIKIYSKPDCSLCIPFKKVIEEICQNRKWQDKVELSEVNIEKDAKAFELYSEKIPVAEINGQLAFKYHITKDEFEKRLMRYI